MRVIIAGSRDIEDFKMLKTAIILSGFEVSTVVCGCARGVDRLGEHYAKLNRIPIDHFPADWKKHGITAGRLRNTDMVRHADALIAVWDGRSHGTRDMIIKAQAWKLRVFVYHPNGVHYTL